MMPTSADREIPASRLAHVGSRKNKASMPRRIAKSPRRHHAGGYGFNELLAGGRIVKAGCWAHVRRKFFDVHAATGSPIAKEALDALVNFYVVEKIINGLPPEHPNRAKTQVVAHHRSGMARTLRSIAGRSIPLSSVPCPGSAA